MAIPQAAPSPPEQFVLVLAAIFLPPLAIILAQRTVFTKEFLVTVVLTFFGHIPGSVFVIYFLFYIDFPSRGVEGYTRISDNESQVGGGAPQQSQGGDSHSHNQNQHRGPGHRLGGEDHTISEQQHGIIHHNASTEGGSQNHYTPYRDDIEGDVENPGAPLLNAGDLPTYDDVVDGKHKKAANNVKSSDNKVQN